MYYKRNIKMRNNYAHGKAISITYSACVSVALFSQHSKRMHHIVL
jgi:hypothetical protein